MVLSPLIGATEAARILGVHARTVKRMIIAGRLEHVTRLEGPTGPYVLRRADVERLAREQRNGAA